MIEILLVGMFAVMIINVPIAVCLGIGSMAALAFGSSVNLTLVAQRMFTACDSTTLMAIPMFIFAGKILSEGGISHRLINFAYATVGWIPGSLGMVSVLACMFFAALSGSSPATVAAIGSIMLPAMIDDGYPIGFAAALICAAGCIGVIIPPSIPFVNYATIANISIGDQFIAGIIPGVMMGLALMVMCFIASKVKGFGQKTTPFNFKVFVRAFKDSFFALMMPVIILGGIYGGIFTPTEAAAVASVYGLVVGYVVYRGFKLREILDFAFDSAKTVGMIFFIVATASIFSWILATEQVPVNLSKAVLGLTDNYVVILLIINLLLLINGCFMELTASTFIYTPILLPLILSLGMDPLQFGVVMVMNMAIGLITPPLGINLFVGVGLDRRVKFNEVVSSVIPALVTLIIILMLVTYIPELSMFLVNLGK
jgi:C4-dicarboxylate transporter DctM subunit